MKTKIFATIILQFIYFSIINAQVTQEWVARYNGSVNGIDKACSIAVDGAGNVYVTGSSEGSGTSDDYATIKYNSAGAQQWVQRYNGTLNGMDWAYSIAVDGMGNVYVTGTSPGSETGYDYATIKYNSAGVQQWVSRYHGHLWDGASSLVVDGSGNVYVTGKSQGHGYGMDWDYATIKYNSAGVQQWASRYNGPGNTDDEALSLAVDGSGNVYVTGWSTGSGTLDDYATIKYNSAGVEQWVQRYNGPDNLGDGAVSIAVDSSMNVYVTGNSTGSGFNSDYATIKYDSAGIQQWVQRYDVSSHDVAWSIAIDGIGNVYVTGISLGYGYATIKYNSEGVQQWIARYEWQGSSYDNAPSIAVDGAGNVYVTGGSDGSGTDYDYATIKYSQLSGSVFEQTAKNALFRLYPNPTTKVVSLNIDNTDNANLTLNIYNVIGTLVKSEILVHNNREINIGDLSNGIYIVEIKSKEWSGKQKLIIQR